MFFFNELLKLDLKEILIECFRFCFKQELYSPYIRLRPTEILCYNQDFYPGREMKPKDFYKT